MLASLAAPASSIDTDAANLAVMLSAMGSLRLACRAILPAKVCAPLAPPTRRMTLSAALPRTAWRAAPVRILRCSEASPWSSPRSSNRIESPFRLQAVPQQMVHVGWALLTGLHPQLTLEKSLSSVA